MPLKIIEIPPHPKMTIYPRKGWATSRSGKVSLVESMVSLTQSIKEKRFKTQEEAQEYFERGWAGSFRRHANETLWAIVWENEIETNELGEIAP